jgi:hypothetical protein
MQHDTEARIRLRGTGTKDLRFRQQSGLRGSLVSDLMRMLKTPGRVTRVILRSCVATFSLVIAFLKGAYPCCRIASWLRPVSSSSL